MLRLASSKLVSSSSTVASNALRAILSPPIIYGSINSAAPLNPNYNFSHNFSTYDQTKKVSDRLLVKALKSEIKCKNSSFNQIMPVPPADFPFTIEDNPHESSLTLRRSISEEDIWASISEDIFVSVKMPSFIPENDDDDSCYKCSCCGRAVEIDLYVSVTNKSRKIVDFGVSVSADEMHIRTMSIIEPESEHQTGQFPMPCVCPHYDVSDVGTEMQSVLGEYLESRGIRKCDALFLYKYMVKKSKQQDLVALEKLKKFVQEKQNGTH